MRSTTSPSLSPVAGELSPDSTPPARFPELAPIDDAGRPRRRWWAVGLIVLVLLLVVALRPARAEIGDETLEIGPVLDHPTDFAWGDMDGDGDLDVAFLEWGMEDHYEVLRYVVYRNGGATFDHYWDDEVPTDYGGSPAWGDLDGDGDLDLAVGGVIVVNTGTGFTEVVTLPDAGWPTWVDFDGDGDLDLSVGGKVYPNHGGVLSTTAALDFIGAELVWGDIDGDGDQDVLSMKGELKVYRNTSGVFTPVATQTDEAYDYYEEADWGDLDRDGDLDLVLVGSYSYGSLVLRNEGAAFIQIWEGFNDESVALGDEDGDGYPDLAFATCVYPECSAWTPEFTYPAVVYRNYGWWSESGPDIVWSSSFGSQVVEWVDWDGDGDLDLSNSFADDTPKLAINRAGPFGNEPGDDVELGAYITASVWGNFDSDPWPEVLSTISDVWSEETTQMWDFENGDLSTFETQDLPIDPNWTGAAAADWNADGTLDVALDGSVLWNNEGELVPFWLAPEADGHLYAPAWADWNSDGYVDLLLTNGDRLFLFENTLDALSSKTPPANNFDLAWVSDAPGAIGYEWADWDNDGDPDLAVAHAERSVQIYENTGQQLSPTWVIPATQNAQKIAWGDANGDGLAELAIASPDSRLRLYALSNDLPAVVWRSDDFVDFGDLQYLKWVDYNSDGDLDLAGNGRLYENEQGVLSPVSRESFKGHWSDWDLDGDLDVLELADYPDGDSVRFWTNWQYDREPQLQYDTYVSISSPDVATEGLGVSRIIDDRYISIEYTIHSHDADKIARIEPFFSLNGGGYWLPATPAAATQLTQLATSPDGVDHTFTWDIFASGLFGLFDNVVFRIDVYAHADDPAPAGTYQYPNAVSRSYQRPARVSARTAPFRVRGTQVQVLQQELQPGLAAAPGAIVYRLKAGETKAAVIGNGADRVFTTNVTGHLQGHGQLNPGDKLVALWPAPEAQQPPADYPYTLYYTNAPVTAAGLQMQPVEGDGVQQLTVSAANPLILFDMVVSLEWDARNDPTFMQQLRNDIGRASEILYDLTDGQAALGQVHLYHDKGHWGVANVVIPAGNHIRPAATLGGIVPRPQPDALKNGTPIEDAFVPGQVRIGPTWNRFGDDGGTLGEDWPRTLAHELGHYLFYLPDNYLGIENGALALVDCVGSAMSDPYRADYSEFLPRHRWAGGCLNTVAEHYLGRADWQTITLDKPGFYRALKTPTDVMDGPPTLPLQVTQITPFAPEDPPEVLAAPFFNIADASGSALAIPQGRGQAYLIKRQRGAAANDPTARYVVELGAPVGPLLNARGAAPGDALCVFDYSVDAADTRLGCVTVGQNPGTVELEVASGWRPLVTVTGRANDEKTVDVVVSGAGGESAMMAQLLPALGAASPEVPMTRIGQNWHATLTVPDGEYNAAFYGYVRVWASAERQTIIPYTNLEAWDGYAYAWGGYAYAWGNPLSAWGGYAYAWGGYAYAWGGYAYAWGAPIMSGDGQVSFLPQDSLFGASELLSLQSQPTADLAPWLTQVGQAYRLRALDNTVPPGSILFRYLARDVPDGMEGHLTIYYQAEGQATWQRLSSTRQPEYNHVAAPAQPAPGTYALVATVEMTRFEVGWNTFAYPIAGAQPVGAALASLGDKYTSVLYFNRALDRWQVYDRTVAAEYTGLVNTLTELRYGEAYWIYATEDTTLYLSAPTTDAPLPAPPNRYFPPATYYGTVTPGTGFTPAAGDTLTATINGAICGQTTLVARNARLEYAVQVQAEALVGAADGCGRDGRAITFTVRGVALSGPTAATWNNTQAHAYPLTGSVAPPAPQITDFNPKSGPVGTVVTLTGANLSNATVRFNGVVAIVSSNTATQIQAAVPAGATDGFIEVTAGGQTATTATPFDVTTPPVIPNVYYLSVAGTSTYTLGNLTGVKQADIVEYTHSTNTWRMVYQGSHASHNTPKNVAAFAMLGDGSLLLVFGANQGISGVTYTPWDIVKFTPNAPNSFPLGAGSYTMWLDGDKLGLAATGEKIDGLAASANGGMLHISTSGAVKVPKSGGGNLVAADEDVMTLTRSSATSGVWSATLRLDGSAVGNLGTSDVNAYWEDAAGNRYLTVLGATPVDLGGGVLAYPKNIVKLSPNGGGWTPSIVSWLASGTLPANLDGLEIKP